MSTLTVTPAAFAQANDPVAATELFKQGREALAKKDYATACTKFEDSLRLDEKVGTLLNLADCEEHQGKIAAARQHLQRAIDLGAAQNDDRVELARQRFAALDKRVPRLTVTLAAPIDGAIVKRDGVELGAGSLGTPLPVEPGKHVVTVNAPKHETRSYDVTVAESEQKALAVEVGPEGNPSTDGAGQADAQQSGSNGLRTAGWITGGVGVAAIATGTVFALIAMNQNSKSDESCDDNNVCRDPGFDQRNDARASGNVATAFFIGGGVALAAGIALVVLSPSVKKTATVTPLVTANGGGLLVGRSF